VTLGTLPLLLLMFQQFSLVSPLANALAIPLVSFVIAPLALLFAVLPWPVLLHFDHWLLSGLMAVLEGSRSGRSGSSRRRRWRRPCSPCPGCSGCCCRAVFRDAGRGCA
jgi:predicted membrane metal-binding protein